MSGYPTGPGYPSGQGGTEPPSSHGGLPVPRDGEQPGSNVAQADGVPPGQYYGPDQETEFNIWEYINVVLRRRWTVIAVFVVCLLTGLIFSFTSTPMYSATTLLQIQPAGPKVTDFDAVQESVSQAQAYHDFFQTQYDILSSRTLARRTIDGLSLDENAFINGDMDRESFRGRIVSFVQALMPNDEATDSEAAAREFEKRLVDRFLEYVTVKPRRRSFLVELSFSSPDPDLSQAVAGRMADQYIDLTLDQSVGAAVQARDFIQKQLTKVKGSLEESEQELQHFARGHDIHALEQEELVIHERLADLNSLLTAAQAKRIGLEAMYDHANSADSRVLSRLVNDDLLQRLREDLSEAEAERAELAARFTDEFPEVRTLSARVSRLKQNLDSEEQRVISSVRSDYEQAIEREGLLREQLTNQKTVVASYEEKAIQFKIHRREVNTNREIYETLLRRMKEVEVTEAIRASNITLVDLAEAPIEPSSPRVVLSLAVAMALGLIGGVGLAFGQEYVDDSLKTPDDVERYLRLATLGTIPEFSLAGRSDDPEIDTPDLEVAHQPTSAGSEAIRTLRASLFLAAPGGLPTRLLLTSARPSEGKTCIAVNLATALAQMGRRVCIIDCDLRRPRVNKALSISLSPGVTNYLTGNHVLEQVIRPSGQPGLDVISAGPIPPNPVDLLDSAAMTRLLRELEERYDHVLIDAPPALGFADVPIISNQLGGGCLLVTRSGETSKRLAKQACDYLIRMQSKLLGVVLNRVSTKRAGYSYYGYYGYYGDYYAKREEDESLGKIESVA